MRDGTICESLAARRAFHRRLKRLGWHEVQLGMVIWWESPDLQGLYTEIEAAAVIAQEKKKRTA